MDNGQKKRLVSIVGEWGTSSVLFTAGSLRWSPTVALDRPCRARSIVTQTGASPARSRDRASARVEVRLVEHVRTQPDALVLERLGDYLGNLLGPG